MDSRRNPRLKRRLQLKFWSLKEEKPRTGFTHNVSIEGMFICAGSPFPPGTRIGIELREGDERLQLYGEVRHSVRVDPVLQKIRPSGMGVRLIKVEEMMAQILRLKKVAAVGSGEAARAETEAEEESESEDRVVSMFFATRKELVNSFERDIKFGGIFVPTPAPPEKDERVQVEFLFDWKPELQVRVPARVVKRFEAAEGSVAGEQVTGVGVAFIEPPEVTEQLAKILELAED